MNKVLRSFGSEKHFCLKVGWASDHEPRARRPKTYGWAVGKLEIHVADQNLTHSTRSSHVGWYIAPFFDWLASNWKYLLQEEAFSWPEKSSAPAVIASRRAIARWITADDPAGKAHYRNAQTWSARHGLRAAAEGGLFPELFVRRLGDEIELSWLSAPPIMPPDDFQFVFQPGVVRLPISLVADPLWEALQWFANNAPPDLDDQDATQWEAICQKIDDLRRISSEELDAAYVNSAIIAKARARLAEIGSPELAEDEREQGKNYINFFSPAVAMFGGVNPNLGEADIAFLCNVLKDNRDGGDSIELSKLVAMRKDAPIGTPHEDGRAFAEEFLDQIVSRFRQDWVDIRGIVSFLEIKVVERSIDDSIRGVALAGKGFSPTIVVNTRSVFNGDENGKRFTLAHELCHILYDRTRARRVSHVSGQWVARGIEMRANAFAAYLLMPPSLVRAYINDEAAGRENIESICANLKVNESALIEHLYNIDLISEDQREQLRMTYRRSIAS